MKKIKLGKPLKVSLFLCEAIITGFLVFYLTGLSYAVNITLSWKANTEPDLAGYNVYYKTDTDEIPYQLYTKIDNPNMTSYTVQELDERIYHFVLTAYDTSGLESAYSEKVTYIPDGITYISEICDGEDNDLDGEIDNGFNVGQSCSAGVGECRGSGEMVCKADGSGTECNAVPGEATAEICDRLDNDCDGEVDNGDFAQYTGTDVGECRRGMMECVNGQMVWIQSEIGPSAEICDELDNDCDGIIDWDFFRDADRDGFGDPMISIEGCFPPPGYVSNQLDCFDGDPNINPKKIEAITHNNISIEDFESGRNQLKILNPSCFLYTSFDLLSDFNELGDVLNFHYKDPHSGSVNSTYWFFGRLSGTETTLPKPPTDGIHDILCVDRLE